MRRHAHAAAPATMIPTTARFRRVATGTRSERGRVATTRLAGADAVAGGRCLAARRLCHIRLRKPAFSTSSASEARLRFLSVEPAFVAAPASWSDVNRSRASARAWATCASVPMSEAEVTSSTGAPVFGSCERDATVTVIADVSTSADALRAWGARLSSEGDGAMDPLGASRGDVTRARLVDLAVSDGVGEAAFLAARVSTPGASTASTSGSGMSWFGGAKGFSNAIRSAANFEMPYCSASSAAWAVGTLRVVSGQAQVSTGRESCLTRSR